jgi:2'-5' RNA ligase
MRLFVGLDIPEDIKDHLGSVIAGFRPAAKVRWSPTANLHITTKFIGEWPEEHLDVVRNGLAGFPAPAPFEIAIRGLGWFPNPHKPRIFWAAIRAGQSLADLAAATESALEPLGIAKENRPYSPHLTLARIEANTELAELRRRVAGLESDDFGQFTATQFHLYLSETNPGGSVYSKLATFPFPTL